jgi:cell division protein FtsB
MARSSRPPEKRARRRPRVRVTTLAAFAALVLIGVLYYKPVRTYLETRGDLSRRTADVRKLEEQRARLERRLEATATQETLTREARRLGFVRPGEQLYIVKGIKAWQRAHTARDGD